MKVNRYTYGSTNVQELQAQRQVAIRPDEAAATAAAPYAAAADVAGSGTKIATGIGVRQFRADRAHDARLVETNYGVAQSELKQNAKLAELHNWSPEQLATANRTSIEAFENRSNMSSTRNRQEITEAFRQQATIWKQESALDVALLQNRDEVQAAKDSYYVNRDERNWATAGIALEGLYQRKDITEAEYLKEKKLIVSGAQADQAYDGWLAALGQGEAAEAKYLANLDSEGMTKQGFAEFSRRKAQHEGLIAKEQKAIDNAEAVHFLNVTGETELNLAHFTEDQLRDVADSLAWVDPIKAAAWKTDIILKKRRLEAKEFEVDQLRFNLANGLQSLSNKDTRESSDQILAESLIGVDESLHDDIEIEQMISLGFPGQRRFTDYDAVASATWENPFQTAKIAQFHHQAKLKHGGEFRSVDATTADLLGEIAERRVDNTNQGWINAAETVLKIRDLAANDENVYQQRLAQFNTSAEATDVYGDLIDPDDTSANVQAGYNGLMRTDDVYDKSAIPLHTNVEGTEDYQNTCATTSIFGTGIC